MIFIETSLFTRLLPELLSDEEYATLQSSLILHPEVGAIIKASGGIRKIRWASRGKGKSGGVRVIYYWAKSTDQIFMLTLYGKGDKQNLSAADLRKVVKLLGELGSD